MARPKKLARKKPTTRKPTTTRNPRPKTKRATKPRARPLAARATKRETKIDHALVERTLALVGEYEQTTTEALRRIGAAVIDDYFGGDTDLAASNDPTKPRSFTKLVDRADDETTWDAADFRHAVRVELVARTLPSTIADRIAPTYLARLAAVDDPADRVALATRIADGDLRGTDARTAIARASGANPAGGRPRLAGPQKLIATLERSVERAEEGGDLAGDEYARVADTARAALARRVRELIDRLRAVESRLGGSRDAR